MRWGVGWDEGWCMGWEILLKGWINSKTKRESYCRQGGVRGWCAGGRTQNSQSEKQNGDKKKGKKTSRKLIKMTIIQFTNSSKLVVSFRGGNPSSPILPKSAPPQEEFWERLWFIAHDETSTSQNRLLKSKIRRFSARTTFSRTIILWKLAGRKWY